MRSALLDEEHPHTATAQPLLIRKAIMRDIPGLLALINDYALKGIMLPRTEFELSENMRDFAVAISDGKLVGCGALHFYSPVVGEIRSLAVSPESKSRGTGREIVQYLIEEAMRYELGAVFAFTCVPGFFARVGFSEVERGALPLKAWKDCLHCRKFQCCDEIAVMRILNNERWSGMDVAQIESSELIQFPKIKLNFPE